MKDELKVGLPPVARADARLFILGSLPGDASLAAGRYYAHPRNQFWRLLGEASGQDLSSIPYDERLDLLLGQRIGLWDVVGSALRKRSLDQSIRLANHNRIERLVHDHPSLEALAFNGATASAIGRRLVGKEHSLELIDLPSSSPANTVPFEKKATAWRRLGPFFDPPPCAACRTVQDGGNERDR